MPAVSAAPVFKLPTEPYPGLRPFLDHEAALLFGRDDQVTEIIARLRQTQFVAVIGGSGSGKSSLIHAGVVPELRSFGIPNAGDFWVPMVCTPGTNVSPSELPQQRQTPITRLAWKFAQLLRSRGSSAADEQRVEEIARVFRQEAGFARLLDAYAKELAVPPGPDPNEARLLFVIDQFEEIFHPTNKGVDDCRLLVERVIDHFFDTHKRCYVVLTMRSEHLSDCAAFLRLPDAINKSSYLVRRLNEAELREAIVGPAQRYLRLLARQAGDASALPEAVDFEPRVIERVLADVQGITDDPDHLPLLQHLLARLWHVACERVGVENQVPAEIGWNDLLRAVSAGRAHPESAFSDKTNVARESLENWAEATFDRQPPAQQPRLEAVLRNLAFKDPKTGSYTQQRINVDDCARFLGEGSTRKDLRALVEDGFVRSVDYLFWDDENPTRVTLKVSHESFIRGWERFRRLIDAEADRFDEFVSLLRKCASWIAAQKAPDPNLLLSAAADLKRLGEGGRPSPIKDHNEREAWFRFLLLDRDGARLAKCEPDIDEFVRAAEQRELAVQTSRRRTRWTMAGLGVVVLASLFPILFSVFVQIPVLKRAEQFFDASSLANQAKLSESYAGIGAAADRLKPLLDAARKIESGRSGDADRVGRTSQFLLDQFAWIPQVKRQKVFLDRGAEQAEPPVNGQLRTLLSNTLWMASDKAASEPLARPERRDHKCSLIDGNDQQEREMRGRLFLESKRDDDPLQRAIFIPDEAAASHDAEVVLRGATYDGSNGRCSSRQIVLPIPHYLEPRILIDAALRYLVVSQAGAYPRGPSVTLYEINWERTEDGQGWGVQSPRPVAVVTGDRAATAVRDQAGDSGVQTMETWRTASGRAFAVGGKRWQVVSASAQRLSPKPRDKELVALSLAAPDSACGRLGKRLSDPRQSEFVSTMYEDKEHCFEIKRGNPPRGLIGPPPGTGATRSIGGATNGRSSATPAMKRDEVLVAVYQRPGRDDAGAAGAAADTLPPPPIASLQTFGRFETGNNDWYVGVSGPYKGWIALRRPSRTGEERYSGAPWSTHALLNVGDAVLKEQTAP